VAAAVGDGLVLLLGVADDARAVRVITAAGTTAVELDTVALAGDAVALAGAGAAVGAGGAVAGAGRRGVGAVGQGRAGGGDGGRAEVGDGVLVVVVGIKNVLVAAGSHKLGGLNLKNGEKAALGDVAGGVAAAAGRLGVLGGRLGGGLAAGLGGRLGGALGGRLGAASGDIEDVQLAASGGLGGELNAGVVGDVVAIDDVVVPVALAGLEGGLGEAESTLPGARLGRGLVLGKGKLALVAVPRSEKVDSLDAGGDAEGERELSGRHFGFEGCY